jgi:hypothetical protein
MSYRRRNRPKSILIEGKAALDPRLAPMKACGMLWLESPKVYNLPLTLAVVLCLTSCGSDVTGPSASSGAGGGGGGTSTSSGSSGSSSSGGSGSSTTSSAQTSASATSSSTGGQTCDELIADANAKLGPAQACNPFLSVPQCSDVLGGVCCPVLVANKNSPEAMAYADAIAAVEAAGCVVPCPAVPCEDLSAGGYCQPDEGMNGHCLSNGPGG